MKGNKEYKTSDNMNKIRITENKLKQIVTESVNKVLAELEWKTCQEDILNESYLNEAGERQFVSSNKLFDVLSTMKGDVRMCVGYMTVAKLNIPQVQRINPATKRNKKYDDWETFGKEIGVEDVAGIIKISKYHKFNYAKPNDLKARYAKYRDEKDAIKQRYGLAPTNRNSMAGKYSTKQEYGDNDIEVYSGKNDEKAGNSYMSQNVHGAKISSMYCLVNSSGNIIKTMTKADLINYLKPFNDSDVNALRKLGKDEEEIKRFLDEIGQLKMSYQKFESSKILYIAATSDALGKFTYINTNMPNVIDGVTVNPQEFINIAAKQYNIDMSKLNLIYGKL